MKRYLPDKNKLLILILIAIIPMGLVIISIIKHEIIPRTTIGKKIFYERRTGAQFGSCADCHPMGSPMSLADPEKKNGGLERKNKV